MKESCPNDSQHEQKTLGGRTGDMLGKGVLQEKSTINFKFDIAQMLCKIPNLGSDVSKMEATGKKMISCLI